MPADRQTIMETNRSLRNIKNELENLLEKGVIDETYYDRIHENLPEESPLVGPLRTKTANGASPAPVQSPPVNAMANLDIQKAASPAPPAYNDTPAPSLPQRNATPNNTKPVIAHARALYHYGASDARDVSFEKDDKVLVHEYMNADWWMGQNTRTGKEGIFPRNYVLVESENKAPVPAAPQYGYPPQPSYAQNGGPPPQKNPYNAHVPPMAVSEGGQPSNEGPSKTQEYGKKFGKKMGNAAIFGAGATIGGKIVNGIF